MPVREGRNLDARVEALSAALALARDRAPAADVNAVVSAEARVRRLIDDGREHTVATVVSPSDDARVGLFNALAGADVAAPGDTASAREPRACTWDRRAATVLDQIGVERRHHVAGDQSLERLVLVELPDPGASAEVLEAARCVVLVVPGPLGADDADALAAVRGRRDVVVVCSSVGEIEPAAAAEVVELRRALDLDPGPAFAGSDVDAVRHHLASLAADRGERLEEADALLREGAEHLVVGGGGTGITPDARAQLIERLGGAIGLRAAGEVVAARYRRDALLAVSWPPFRPVRRRWPKDIPDLGRDGQTDVIEPEVDAALRGAADQAVEGMQPPWDTSVRAAVTSHRDAVVHGLALVGLRTSTVDRRRPKWWDRVGLAQQVLFGVTLAGLAWAILLAAVWAVGLEPALPAGPAVLVGVSLGASVVVAVGARVAVRRHAARRARRLRGRLRRSVADIVQAEVIRPVDQVLGDRAQIEKLLRVAAPADRVVTRTRSRGDGDETQADGEVVE